MIYYPDHVLDDEVFAIILSTCHSASIESLRNTERFRQRARTIGSNIYDMTIAHSGKISWGCIIARREKAQDLNTKEHYNGRQEGGEACLRYVKRCKEARKKIDDLHIKMLIDRHRQVHYTSSEENNALRALADKQPHLKSDWETMYRMCKIDLQEYVKGKRYDSYKRKAPKA